MSRRKVLFVSGLVEERFAFGPHTAAAFEFYQQVKAGQDDCHKD